MGLRVSLTTAQSSISDWLLYWPQSHSELAAYTESDNIYVSFITSTSMAWASLTTEEWLTLRLEVMIRDRFRCTECGNRGPPLGGNELHVNHIIPRSEGGDDEKYNLHTLCVECHDTSHSEIPDDFISGSATDMNAFDGVLAILATKPFVTTHDLAEKLDKTTETARLKLIELEELGVLHSESVGSRAKVWYPENHNSLLFMGDRRPDL